MYLFFVCKDTATTEIYTYGHTLSLHDALPICRGQLPEDRDLDQHERGERQDHPGQSERGAAVAVAQVLDRERAPQRHAAERLTPVPPQRAGLARRQRSAVHAGHRRRQQAFSPTWTEPSSRPSSIARSLKTMPG